MLAVNVVPKDLGTIQGEGPLGIFSLSKEVIANLFDNTISAIIGILTVSASLWFIFQFLIGAFSWLTAGSDKSQLENAQKRITNAVIGLVIVVAAIFIIEIIGNLLGLKVLQPGSFILSLWGAE